MKKYQKRIISFCSAIMMMASSLPMEYIPDGVKELSTKMQLLAYAEGDVVALDSVTKFIAYSKNYDASHVNDTISLTFGNDSTMGELTGFTSIAASEDIAFNGKIIIGDGMQLNLPTTMFGWITDDVEIVKASNNSENAVLAMTRTKETVEDKPLFAENVKHTRQEGSAAWSFQYDEFREDESTSNRDVFDFSGYIGTLETNASVKIESIINNNQGVLLGNPTYANVSSSGDTGLVCRTMKQGSTLEVDYIECESGNFKVSGATAGGLVGSMDVGTTLILGDGLTAVQDNGQEITASAGYAGGLVGSCKGTITFSDSAYAVNQMITGTSGSGGIAGYYENAGGSLSFSSFELNNSARINGSGVCGGYFGKLKNSGDLTITVGKNITADHGDATSGAFGGLIGDYEAAALSNSLTVKTNDGIIVSPKKSGGDAKLYGGIIGKITGSSYVDFDGVTVNSSNSNGSEYFGGLVGSCVAGFIELSEINTVSYTGLNNGRTFGGIIGNLENGVLILSGTTDLTGGQNIGNGTVLSGQLVGYRNNGFVWAENGWTLYRSGAGAALDDIGSWGEVLNHSGGLTAIKSSLIEISDHAVTIKPCSTSITDLTTFAQTALNIGHNDGIGNAVIKVSEGSRSSDLLSDDLSINGTIDLSKTGITGLTRDGCYNNNKDNPDLITGLEYTGNITGSAVITLSAGENYAAVSGKDDGNGSIYRHQYNGLIGRTNNASVSGITISADSKMDIRAYRESVSAGNIVAYANGALSLDGIKVSGEIAHSGGSDTFRIGGFVGCVGGSVNIGNTSDCEFSGNILGNSSLSLIGGAIGDITNTSTFTSSVTNTTVSGTITAASERVGGLIGTINTSNTASSSRTLALDTVKVNGLSLTNSYNGTETGGLLGYTWKSTDVTFDNVEIGSKLDVATTSAAGLVYLGTGYWKVNTGGIKIDGSTIKADSATNFGMLMNESQSNDKALYLEILEQSETAKAYKIGTVGLTLPACNVFDEIVAYTAESEDAVLTNGQSIVSINTYDGKNESSRLLKMGSSDTNTGSTYQNQTTFSVKHNPNTRYYYNLDMYRQSPSDGAEKLLLWSVYQYAHSSVRSNFISGNTNSLSGTFNMRGYSYYPVDLSGSLTISGTLALYNPDFDTTEGNTSDKRKSTEVAQHKLIHNALLQNLSGTLNVTGLTLEGEVSSIDGMSGVLVYNTMGSASSANPATLKVDGLTLRGIKINGTGPLLVNSAGSNSTFNISDVNNSHNVYNDGGTIATALLGTIGSDNATNVKLNFSKIQLDGRKADLAADAGLDSLTAIYGTTHSLFSNAILIDSLAYQKNSGSNGIYNYEYSLDWNDNGEHIGQVTYGAEIDGTKENKDDAGNSMQTKYNGSGYYTHPTMANALAAYGKFADYFQKYVGSDYTENGTYHELRVNISTTGFDGCGTYDDPYLITTGADLEKIAKLINGNFKDSTSIKVPNSVCNPSAALSTSSKTWCTNKADHTEFTTYDTEIPGYKTADGTLSIGYDDLREYLAGAYYMIPDTVSDKIELSNSFEGISSNAITDNKFVFRGVIIGNGGTILNKSNKPLIISSNGSVVKNLTIEVQPTKINSKTKESENDPVYLTMSNNQEYNYYNKSSQFYGGVIGQILGGDNIIDSVSIKYSGIILNACNGAGKTTYSNRAQLVPIGGYVGVIVNGGLIFRGMTGTAANNQSGLSAANLINFTGGGDENPLSSNNKKWLYVNPIIGRVINGYAVTESNAYRPYENGTRVFQGGAHTTYNSTANTYDITDESELVTETWAAGAVTMRNGTKNYSITDISTTEGKLSLSSVTAVTAPSAQSFFLMACMVNSGLAKKSLGYNQAYQVSRYASYSNVGEMTASTDYTTAKDDVLNSSNISELPGYIAYAYTDSAANASDMANQSTVLTLNSGAYALPDGYKGLGNIYQTTDVDKYRMTIQTLNGNHAVISQNTEFYTIYSQNTNHHADIIDYYKPYESYVGIGLINYQNKALTVNDLTLKGNVIADAFSSQTGDHIEYFADFRSWVNEADNGANEGIDRTSMPNVGSLVGHSKTTLTINEVNLDNIYVHGLKNAGGMIGAVGADVTTITNSKLDSDRIKVHGATTTGGLIGRNNRGNLIIDFGGTHFNLTEVISECEGESNLIKFDSIYGVGGIVGCTRTDYSDQNADANANLRTNSFKNINIGDSTKDVKMTIQALNQPILTGGIAGVFDRSEVIVENCHLYNLDLTAKYYAGGVFAQIGTSPNTRGKSGRMRELTIKNVTIEKTDNYTGTPQIVSTDYSAGGIFAAAKQDLQRNLCITNCAISDYLIKGKEFSGGVCAVWSFTQDQDVATKTSQTVWKYNLVIRNSKISDCELIADDSVGGLVGVNNVHHQVNPSYSSKQSANVQYIYGYNILTKNLTYGSNTEGGKPEYAGHICGYNEKTIQIVGYSQQSDGELADIPLVGECNSSEDGNIFGCYDGKDGYCIFADYDGVAETSKKNGEFSPINGEYNSTVGSEVKDVLKYTVTTVDVTNADGTTSHDYYSELEHLGSSYPAVTAYKKTVIADTSRIEANGNYTANNNTYSRKTTEYDSLTPGTLSTNVGKLRYRTKTQQYNKDGTLQDKDFGDYKFYGEGTEITTPMTITDETVTIDNKQTGIKTVTRTITTIVNVYDNFPYVTSSPKMYITDTQFLTDDAVSKKGYLNSTTQHILDDATSNTSKSYQNTGLTPTELNSFKSTLSDKMLGFSAAHNCATTEYHGAEFPVLVIDDIDSANTIINNYLRLMTNTKFNFNEENDAVYNIDVSKMVYDTQTNTFVRSSDEAALKYRKGYGFRITSTDVDNVSLQFSLLDVQFKDPSLSDAGNTGTYAVAYHLYVPVVVKKMLHYGFKARFSSGSTYDLSKYPSSVRNLMENLGNPVTLKFTYNYRQSAEEWAEAINSGENVQRNYDKELTFKATPGIFPEGAQLVLVDPNNNADKYYTADFKGSDSVLQDPQTSVIGGVEVTEYRLKLNAFDGFEVCKINDLMIVSLDTDEETAKTLVEAADNEDCIVIINDGSENNGLRLRLAEEGETAEYAVSVSLPEEQEYPEENYYLSFFTKPDSADNNIYHYEISSTSTFGDSEYPSARVSNESPHLFLGNLYENDVTLTEVNQNREMSKSNNYLEADLKAKVGFTENAVKGGIINYIDNDNVVVYQTFLTSLNMLDRDEDGKSINSRGLLVKPNATATEYMVAGTDRSSYLEPCKYSNSYVEIPNSYSIKNDLRNKARSGDSEYTIDITARIKMVYDSDVLSFQFPESEESATDIGTYMIGYSNISSSPGQGAASRASDNTEETPLPATRKLYYMRNISPVDFSYNAVANENFTDDGNGNYGQLGINANEETADSVLIRTAATYDISSYGLRTRANYVKIQVKLSKKSAYETALDMSKYLTEYELLDADGNDIVSDPENHITVDKDGSTYIYTYIVPKSSLQTISDNVYYIPINFKAYTGYTDTFEKNNGKNDMQYSNYRMTVIVGLLENEYDTELMTNSYAFDHVIWTNARLLSDIVTPKD